MGSRWIHRPRLHVPSSGQARHVGWLELFYDLVYVASFVQLGNALSSHVSVGGFLAFAGLMVPLWLTWTSFTFYSNRFVIDDAPHRGLVFLQMFAIAGVAICVPQVMDGDTRWFALSYAAARLVMVALYARVYLQEPVSAELSRRYLIWFGIGALIWLVSAWVPAPWCYGLWALGLVAELVASTSRPAIDLAARFPPDSLHMTERYGLLTLIVLGESFVKVLTELSSAHWTPSQWPMGAMGLLITCAIWWLYFDDVAGSRIKRIRLAGFAWVYAHLPLTIAITATGVAIKKVVTIQAAAHTAAQPATPKYQLLLVATLVMALLSVAAIDTITERRSAHLSDRARVRARLITALLILGMAFLAYVLSVQAWLLGITFILFVQVLFDISMAPEVVDSLAEAHLESHAVFIRPEPATSPSGTQGDAEPAPKRWAFEDVVRRGAPNELRRDLYFHFVEGSWTQAIVTIVVAFIIANAIFASLYLADPGGVVNLNPTDFLRAFSFSVQTMASVGYGTMAPDSGWANVISMIEAGVGLLGIALATGLMFAKASRPRSSVLFSKVFVIGNFDGVPRLRFRAANARGNEVVDAAITVSALIDTVTPEGHKLRKLVDLDLVRRTSPLFTMTWTVMHPLTPDSPLHGVTPDSLPDTIWAIIVNLTGHDATYASTTHARMIYFPEDARWNARFVDVLHTLDDGRLMIDYAPFHDTIPDQAQEAQAQVPGTSS